MHDDEQEPTTVPAEQKPANEAVETPAVGTQLDKDLEELIKTKVENAAVEGTRATWIANNPIPSGKSVLR